MKHAKKVCLGIPGKLHGKVISHVGDGFSPINGAFLFNRVINVFPLVAITIVDCILIQCNKINAIFISEGLGVLAA
ncbi:hypothetical protein DSECCO2_629160 [anaerobic digester metagenome]